MRANSCDFTEELSAIESSNGVDDFIELRSRQLGIDRQGQDFLRGAFRLGAASFLVPDVREARLQVQREGIVDRVADAACLEGGLQIVAAVGPDGVLIEDRLV